jgi:Major capsid protein Gp23
MEGESNRASINIELDFVNIAIGPDRMLQANYTPQLKQDVHAFHSIDIESEFTKLMAEIVSGEIDREILRDLSVGAAHTAAWNYGLYDALRKSTDGSTATIAITKKEYAQELIMVINEVSAKIQKSTMSKGATWLVASPEISALFSNLENFHVTSDGPEDSEYSMGIDRTGSLNSRYKVYVDTQAPAGLLLMGNKGDSVFRAGYLYCPYVPLMVFPALQSPTDRRTVLDVMTRYAKKLVNNRYYGRVYVDGLNALDVNQFIGTI